MKERPIIFSAEMVRAILEGRKTQGRRAIEPQPKLPYTWAPGRAIDGKFFWCDDRDQGEYRKCPYGVPGDRLWVREASYITLEITRVRAQRIQDISEDDAAAEGIERHAGLYILDFARLWDSINAKRGYSWASNPWVWVVDFKVQ